MAHLGPANIMKYTWRRELFVVQAASKGVMHAVLMPPSHLQRQRHDLLLPAPQAVSNALRLDGMVAFEVQQRLTVAAAGGVLQTNKRSKDSSIKFGKCSMCQGAKDEMLSHTDLHALIH